VRNDVPTRTPVGPDKPAVFGLLVHTCGQTIVQEAVDKGLDVGQYVADYYDTPGVFAPNYVCDWNGKFWKIAEENRVMPHCGRMPPVSYQAYVGTSWQSRVSATTLEYWKKHWPGKDSPNQLFPTISANYSYVGIEFTPIVPTPSGLRFTEAQHIALVNFAINFAVRNRLPRGWQNTSRFLAHEDLDPITRSDAGGGWDIGWLRPSPYFDLGSVRSLISGTAPETRYAPGWSPAHSFLSTAAVLSLGAFAGLGVGMYSDDLPKR
jgi:hypothetical protein